MRTPPRRADARLFDRAVLGRGLWQGSGLLLLLLTLYAGVGLVGGSEPMARALTFAVLVLSNLALIYANRSWSRVAWHPGAGSNRSFRWSALATLVLLACVLAIPTVSGMFAFARPTPGMLLAGAATALLALLWFEGVKWALGRRRPAAPARMA